MEFGHVDIGPKQRVAACRMMGDTEDMMMTPDQWKSDGSLGQTFGFVPTGEEVYVGRTGEH